MVFQRSPSLPALSSSSQGIPSHSQMVLIIPPIGSGSTESTLPSWVCPDDLQSEASTRHLRSPNHLSRFLWIWRSTDCHSGSPSPSPCHSGWAQQLSRGTLFCFSHILVLSLTTRIFWPQVRVVSWLVNWSPFSTKKEPGTGAGAGSTRKPWKNQQIFCHLKCPCCLWHCCGWVKCSG